MEKITRDVAIEGTQENSQDSREEIRTLQELELLLVGGGGDDAPNW